MAATMLLFPAMGTTAKVIVVGDQCGRLASWARDRVAELEQRWSRFLRTSEVSRLNAGECDVADISVETRLLLNRAEQGFDVTGGRFNPYLLAEVMNEGYDRSRFERTTDEPAPSAPSRHGRFDPGGIGKGLAADLVVAELLERGAEGAMVELGGDLRVSGSSPDGAPWLIDIEDPRDGSVLTQVELDGGAVTTSSRMKRRWFRDGRARHHLIDPSTRASAETPVMSATVIAAEGWQAEVLAKAVLIDPFGANGVADDSIGGTDLVEELGAAALIVTEDLVLRTARWSAFDAAEVRP